jgi:hypothetical protein
MASFGYRKHNKKTLKLAQQHFFYSKFILNQN